MSTMSETESSSVLRDVYYNLRENSEFYAAEKVQEAMDTIRHLRDALVGAGQQRGRLHDGSYLSTFGPEGRFSPEELVAIEEAARLIGSS